MMVWLFFLYFPENGKSKFVTEPPQKPELQSRHQESQRMVQ
jgi:hypothetical protein